MGKEKKSSYEDIKILTFLNLLKVLKERKLYCKFRAMIGVEDNKTSSIYRTFTKTPSNKLYKSSSLSLCNSFKELLKESDNFINFKLIKSLEDEEAKKQMYISECVNLILHNILEKKIELRILSEIGENVFNMTCIQLFGEGFEDKTPKKPKDEEIKFIEELLKGKIRYNDLYSPTSWSEITNSIWADNTWDVDVEGRPW